MRRTELPFQKVVDEPVHSIAFGTRGRVGALGKQAWMGDGGSLEALPDTGVATADVDIYFGRDNLPRLMGFEQTDKGLRNVYRRYRGGAWQGAAFELGRLGGGSPAPLFGVLGNDDPEVVCKVGEPCIVKRRSGWQTIPALPTRAEMVLSSGQTWAAAEGTLWRLGEKAFEPVGAPAPFRTPSSVWAVDDQAWVTEPSRGALHAFRDGSWVQLQPPVAEPRAVWAAAPQAVWVAGKDGLARFDGQTWTRIDGILGPLTVIASPDGEQLWVGGPSGLWLLKASERGATPAR